jgi:hypothetical protein
MHGKRNFQRVREILRAISRENVEIVVQWGADCRRF